MSYENPWTLDGQIVDTENIKEHYGFVYRITNLTSNKKYIGKKFFYATKTKQVKKKKKRYKAESDWKTYYGSHAEIKSLIKEGKQSEFLREILIFTANKKLHTYYENKFLFIKEVIEPHSNYINDNIEGRYFRKDFI